MYYHNWTRTTLTAFVPFVLLAVLNGRIIFQIRKAEKLMARMVSGWTTTEQKEHVRYFSNSKEKT